MVRINKIVPGAARDCIYNNGLSKECRSGKEIGKGMGGTDNLFASWYGSSKVLLQE